MHYLTAVLDGANLVIYLKHYPTHWKKLASGCWMTKHLIDTGMDVCIVYFKREFATCITSNPIMLRKTCSAFDLLDQPCSPQVNAFSLVLEAMLYTVTRDAS